MSTALDNRDVTTQHTTSSLAKLLACAALALGIAVANAATAQATSFTISTDGTWLAKNATPGAGWNTNASFNTAADGGWVNASVNIPSCVPSQDCIWYDGTFSTTEQAWLRKTFVLDGPATVGSLIGGVDDDATIWINGTIVYSVFDGLAGAFGPINIASFLVPGTNLIAVYADDNLFYGNQHTFAARLDIETASAVPDPGSTLLLFGIGIVGLRAWRMRLR